MYLAALWCVVGAAATVTGLAHSYQIVGNQVNSLLIFAPATEGALTYRAFDLTAGYLLMAAVFCLIDRYAKPGEILDEQT